VFATDGSGQGGQAGWGLTSVRTPHTKACRRTRTQGSTPRRLSGRSAGGVITYFNPNQQPGRAPRSDASNQQHRRAQRGLPRADGRARAGAAGRGSAHPPLSDSQISRSAPRARAARLLDWRILGVAQCLLQVILCQDRSHQLRCWLLHLPPALGGKNPMMLLDLQYNKCCEYFTSCSRLVHWSWS
jgi:hypothetical protein